MAVSHEECTPYVYYVVNRKCVPPPAAAAEFERSGTTRRAARAIGQFRRRILAGEDTDDGLRTSRFAHLSPHARPIASTRPRTPHPPRARPHQALDQKNSHDGLHRGRGRALRPGRRVPGSLHPHAALSRGHLSPGDHQHRCVPASARRPPARTRISRSGLRVKRHRPIGAWRSRLETVRARAAVAPSLLTDPPLRIRPALRQVRSVTSRTVSRRS
jgi:hypothetical protein